MFPIYLFLCLRLRLDRRQCRGVHDVLHGAAPAQVVAGPGEALEDGVGLRPADALGEFVGDVPRLEVREDEHVGPPGHGAPRGLTYEAYIEEWLDFILTCRRERDETDYDIMGDGIAIDRAINAVELFYRSQTHRLFAEGVPPHAA